MRGLWCRLCPVSAYLGVRVSVSFLEAECRQKNATMHPDDPGLRVFNEARFCLFINPITWCDETSLPNTAEPEKEINNGKHKVLTDSR